MLAWFFASPAERRLIGSTSKRATTPWVIAIMSFSIMLIAASGLALANTAHVLGRAIESRYAVEVPAGRNDLQHLLGVVRAERGVRSADAVPESDMRRTLERWLGPAAQSRDLPVPGLINVDLEPGVDEFRVATRLQSLAPGVTVTSHRDDIAPLMHSLTLLEVVALGLVLLLSAAAGAAVVLAARGALDTHRFTIEVMHGIGATDLQVTHLFQRKIAIDALIGSLAGGAAAGIVLLLLAGGAAFAGEFTGGATLDAPDLILLAFLPLLLTALATWVGRVAVLHTLQEAL